MAGSMSLPSMITLRAGATRYGLRRTADVIPTEPEKPMSDDTPTQRFSAPREPEDESTRRLDQVEAGGDETQRLDQVADTPTRRLDQVTDATVPFAAHVPLASLPPDRAAYAPAPPAAGPPVRPRGDKLAVVTQTTLSVDDTHQIVEALRERGLPVAYQTFEGEGHGFRSADAIVRWFESDLYFYGRVLGFEPADALTAFEIENLD